MYQSVDDNEEIEEKNASKDVGRLKLLAALIVGVAVLAAVAVFSSSNTIVNDVETIATAEQYDIYFKALGEPEPALRRARLLDFVQNYPDHDRRKAAEAQLSVIQQADDMDWFSLNEIIFDPGQSKPAKLAAIDLYEDMWGATLLGGREDEVMSLREQLTTENDPAKDPSEKDIDFTPKPDKFGEDISGTELAGDVVVFERTYVPPAPVIRNTVATPRNVQITKPKIRKDRRPKYPRKALRRNIEAEVVLALSVDDKGEVQMTEVVSVRAQRYRKDFIKAAERAALRTKYFPKKVDGKPVPATGVLKKYVFKIQR